VLCSRASRSLVRSDVAQSAVSKEGGSAPAVTRPRSGRLSQVASQRRWAGRTSPGSIRSLGGRDRAPGHSSPGQKPASSEPSAEPQSPARDRPPATADRGQGGRRSTQTAARWAPAGKPRTGQRRPHNNAPPRSPRTRDPGNGARDGVAPAIAEHRRAAGRAARPLTASAPGNAVVPGGPPAGRASKLKPASVTGQGSMWSRQVIIWQLFVITGERRGGSVILGREHPQAGAHTLGGIV
jgi:hypothetical protein